MTILTVLIVDDELEFAQPLATQLEMRGVAVKLAQSGQAALDLLLQEQVDVVVLDVCMEGMDGIETLSEINRINSGVGIIMLSGHADVGTASLAMSMGAFDYLVKPIKIDELFFRIQDVHKTRQFDVSAIDAP